MLISLSICDINMEILITRNVFLHFIFISGSFVACLQ